MKYMLLGIKDYCKDCWRDFWFWLWDSLETAMFRRLRRTYCWRYNEGCFTKEGNLKHYIQNRRLSK